MPVRGRHVIPRFAHPRRPAGHRSARPPRGRPPPDHRPRLLQRRRHPAAPGLRGVRALAPRPRGNPAHRRARCSECAGRARRADRDGHRRARGDPASPGADQSPRSSAAQPRRLGLLRRAPPSAARRPRASRRRAHRHGDRRDAGPRARRRRARGGRLRSPARGGRCAGRRGTRRADRLGRGGQQPVRRFARRRRDGGRGGDRRGGARRELPDAREPGHRRPDGAADGGGRLGRGQRPLHRVLRLGGLLATARRDRRRPRRAGERGTRGGARRGRQLRHAQQLLSRVRAGGLGRPSRRPTGEVDGRRVWRRS